MATDDKTTVLLREYDRLIDTHVYHSRFATTGFPLILALFGVLAFSSKSEIVTPLSFLYLFGILMSAMNLCHRIAIQTGIRLIESEAKLNYHLQLRGDMRLSRFTRTDLSGFDWLYLLPMIGVFLLLMTLLWIAALNAPEKGTFHAIEFLQALFKGAATKEDILIAIPLFLSIISAITMVVMECRFQRSLQLDAEDEMAEEGEDIQDQGLGEFLLKRRARGRIKRS